jgi:iron complex transport system substrate-binding protein
VEANLRKVATALGEPRRAAPWVKRLRALRQSAPRKSRDSIWLGSGGDSLASGSVGAEWLRLAGLRQRQLRGGRATLETLLVRPPQMLVQSRYRREQVSRGSRWLDHPVIRNLPSRRLTTDGRAWTCMGPLLIPEIERLRKAVR